METSTRIQKVVRYKKGFTLSRKLDEAAMKRKGWVIVREEEVKQFNGAKALGLGLIFLPLALLGSSKYVNVTYEKNAS